MTTAYTSLLGLALPVTGELSGTWGDTVNNSITSLLDTSVAGTTNVSADTDVTLTTTTGAANTARQAILLFSGARTALRTVVAPAQSKTYTVINATTGGFAVKLVGSGPTTGVTIIAGESAFCAWNGSDFVKVSNTGGAYTVTDLTVTGNTILGDANTDTATVNALGRFNALATFGYAGTTGSTLTTTAPAFVYSGATTYTDTSISGGTKAHGPFWALAAPTLANPTTATTYTNASTLYIAGAPVAGTNITITNPYSVYVAAGASYFGGAVNFAGNTTLTTTTVTSLTDSGLTAGRVTYATTGGLLTDSANLTFNGTTLTANTIGAFTLGGTIAGGGNQINNVIIGTTNPLAGAFTTLSATGLITGRSTNGQVFTATNSADSTFSLDISSAKVTISQLASAGILDTVIGSTTRTSVSSTGLAVTGTAGVSSTLFKPEGTFVQWNSTGAAGGTNRGIVWADSSSNLYIGSGSGNSTVATFNATGVGIGTNNPQAKLELGGTNPTINIGPASITSGGILSYNTSGNYLTINAVSQGVAYRNIGIATDGGNVGVGLVDPAWRLMVKGLSSGTVGVFAYDGAFGGAGESNIGLRFYNGGLASDMPQIQLAGYGTTNYTGNFAIRVMQGGTYPNTMVERFTVQGTTGNVGIGNDNPQSRLHIQSTVGTSETLVTLQTGWSSPSGNKSIAWTDGSGRLGAIGVNYTAPQAAMTFGSLYNSGYNTTDLMTLTPSGLNVVGNISIGTTNNLNVLNLIGQSNGGGISWGNYMNVFSEYSSGAAYISSNYYPTYGASGYKTTLTASFGAAGISVTGTGGASNGGSIFFYVDPATSKTAGAAFTPTEVGRFTAGGTFKVGNPTATVGTNNLFIAGSGNQQNGAVVVVNTADANVNGIIISNWDGAATTQGPRITFDNSGRGSFTFGGSDSANNFDICQNWGTPALRIDGSDNVLVGATSLGTTYGATSNVIKQTGGVWTDRGQFSATGGSTTTFVTLANVSNNQSYIVSVRQSGAGGNFVSAFVVAYGASASSIRFAQDNTNPVLDMNITNSGLAMQLVLGSGFGNTTWDWVITRLG